MHTSDTQFAHWLSWFVDPDNSRVKAPFRLTGDWMAATDGRIAVGAPLDPAVNLQEISGNRNNNASKITAILCNAFFKAVPEKSATLSRDAAIAMFGPCQHPTAEKCTTCKGKKRVKHDCGCDQCNAEFDPCEDCEGTGIDVALPELRFVSLWGEPFDANLVAYVLEHAPPAADWYEFSLIGRVADIGANKNLVIKAPVWSALVAPCVDKEGDRHGAERPPTAAADTARTTSQAAAGTMPAAG